MSSDKDHRLEGIFRSMKVPGFDKPKAPSADPRLLAPMVVEVDLLTNRIKKVETQAHDSPEHVKQMRHRRIRRRERLCDVRRF